MKKFEIGIIGGTGGIGKWFADFFTKEKYTVHVSGRHTGMDMKQMAEQCRVVIVSVPISVTCEVIEQIGPFMKEESLLMDFTSLKEKPVQAMLQYSASEVMGCHPLFGPDIASIKGHNIVFCPGRIKTWSGWPRDLFEKKGAHAIEMTSADHDEMMAIIQGLNHFNTIMMELAIRSTGVDRSELKECSTPIFNTKLGIIDKICTTEPRLHAELLTLNPYLSSILDLYEKNLTDLKSLIKSGDTEGLMKLIKK